MCASVCYDASVSNLAILLAIPKQQGLRYLCRSIKVSKRLRGVEEREVSSEVGEVSKLD